MDNEKINNTEEDAILEALEAPPKPPAEGKKDEDRPPQVFIIPLNRRPFFPGMAAPVVIEPGPFMRS